MKDTQEQLQEIIIRTLLTNDDYMRKVVPFLEPTYFEGIYSTLFKAVAKYVAKYNKLPTYESLNIFLPESNLFGQDIDTAHQMLPDLFEHVIVDMDWLLESTENWCQDRALFNAVMESIMVMNGDHKTLTKDAIPDILTRALGVSFDRSIGHDYLDNWNERYEFYHEDLERIPFDIDILNKITKGGLIRKTLNVLMAGTGVGKSLCMCHMAAANLSMGYNVLYITAEMAEERIAERIDANLFNIPIDQLEHLSKDMFRDRVMGLANKTNGKLIIKEYPTSQGNTNHFRALLNELKLKKNFVPTVIYIDYLNICSSSRLKNSGGDSYGYIKAIAEEIRGLAVEFNVPIVTATQTNREGFASSDPGLTDTSESFGLPATSDLFLVLVSTDELEALGQMMWKQLKNRYADLNSNKRFVVGVSKAKMQLFDVAPDQQNLVQGAITTPENDIPIFDNTPAGKRIARDTRDFSSVKFDA